MAWGGLGKVEGAGSEGPELGTSLDLELGKPRVASGHSGLNQGWCDCRSRVYAGELFRV